MLLGSGSSPSVEFLDLSRGDRVPWAQVSGAPFDHALSRRGWIAIQAGYALHSVRDGDLGSLRPLPDVWMVHPAADPAQLLARRRQGPGLVLLDADGVELAQSNEMQQPLGELHGGTVVCEAELRTWDGDASPLPVAGSAVAVLDGTVIVTWEDGILRTHDVASGEGGALDLRGRDLSLWGNPSFDREGQRGAWGLDGTVVVVGPGTAAAAIDCEQASYGPVWLDDQHLVLAEDGDGWVLDLATGTTEPIAGLAARSWPRLDVTDRLDPTELRGALAPPAAAAAIDEAAWQADLDAQRERMAEAAADAELGPEVAADAAPAVRLLPRLGAGSVGGTRLGGQPDVSDGWSWPRHEGAPMAFLAQLRVPQLHPGLVSIFATIEPDGHWPPDPRAVHVEVFEPGTELAEAPVPDDLDADLRFGAAAAVLAPYLSPPCGADLEEVYDFDALEVFDEAIEPDPPLHQVLGFMGSFQGQTNPEDQQLLLQLDSDSIMGVMWADGGRLFVWGPEELPDAGVVADCTIDMDSG